MARPGHPAYVYFVRRADGEGPVKIGCSSHPEVRLTQLMCWAPYPLAIAATLPGNEELEYRFHARFRHLRSHREWFHPAPELDAVIAAIQAGTFDIATLPRPARLPLADPVRAEVCTRLRGARRSAASPSRRAPALPHEPRV
jgi:hypothetical protein